MEGVDINYILILTRHALYLYATCFWDRIWFELHVGSKTNSPYYF
jgi:hypothetical protein